MSHYYQILFSILFTNIILIQSTVILAQSGTKTQIISPSFKRAQLATGRDYLYKPLTNAPNAKWIWYGMVDDCGCAKNNITIQHFFKLKCLTSKIYIQVNGVDYYYVYINGKKLFSYFVLVDSQIDTSNNTCDDIFNLTIQVKLFGYFYNCCGLTPGSLIYTVYADDCNNRLCQCNNLVQETCSSQNCTGPINYITDQRSHISKPNPLIQELSCIVCGNGFFLNLQTGYCNFCSENCLTCNSTSSYCLSCNYLTGFYFDITSNTCMSCQLGYYVDPLTINLCKSCSHNCLTCNSFTYCLSCNISNSLYLNITSNACVDCKSIGYYIDSQSNLCQSCSDNCLTCNSTSSYCLSCDISNSLYLNITSNACVDCKSIGYYIDSQSNLCQSCSDNCLTCNSTSSYCLSCDISNGLYLNITSNTCNSISSYSLAAEGKNNLSPGIVAGISVVFIVFIIMIIVAIYLYLHKKKQEEILVQQQIKDTDSNKILQIESNSTNCSFCIEDNCNLITSCQHQFHVQCLKQWIRKNKKCPTCHNENIEMIKIMMCKKCKIYQHFDITSSRFNFNYNSSINSVKNHECIMKIEKINTN